LEELSGNLAAGGRRRS